MPLPIIRSRGMRMMATGLSPPPGRRDRARRMALLTAREREVLRLLAEGTRAVGIAEHFVVSVATVRSQIQSILAKLEVKSQLEAVALHNQQR